MSKKTTRVCLALVLLLLVGSSVHVAASDTSERIAFNIDENVYAVNLGQSKTSTFPIARGGKGSVAIDNDGNITVSIPQRRMRYKGTYDVLVRCPGSPLVVIHWRNRRQERALRKVHEEVAWLAQNNEATVQRSPNLHVYVSTNAQRLLKQWDFALTPGGFLRSGQTTLLKLRGRSRRAIFTEVHEGAIYFWRNTEVRGINVAHKVESTGKVTFIP